MKCPDCVARLFWEYDISTIDESLHKNFIIERILEKGNFLAINWLFRTYTVKEIYRAISSSNISKETRFFWQNYFAIIENI
jgi:hypothetical protein